jgi:hypothetical protein
MGLCTAGLGVLMFLGVGQSAAAGPYGGFPEVSVGVNPNRNFSGEVSGPGTNELLVVPEEQDFIITTIKSDSNGVLTESSGAPATGSGIQLLQDGAVVLRGQVIGPYSGSSISIGKGHLRIEAGTTLSLQNLNGWPANYYVQGYLVQQGSPYRSVYGVTPSESFDVQPIFSTEDDRVFLIRTAVFKAYGGGVDYCDLAVNDETIVDGSSMAMYDNGTPQPFVRGNGALSVPPGSTIQVRTYGRKCDYYIDGEYIQP